MLSSTMRTPSDLFLDWQRSVTPADRSRWLDIFHARATVGMTGNRQIVALTKYILISLLRHELGETESQQSVVLTNA